MFNPEQPKDKNTKILKSNCKALEKLLTAHTRLMIVSHENPDGDAVGSALALKLMLHRLGKEASVWLPGRFPAYYRWLSSSDTIRYLSEQPEAFLKELAETEVLIGVDLSSLSRTGKMAIHFTGFTGKRVLIDHHIDPEESEFNLVFSDVTVSSTSELICHIFEALGWDKHMDRPVAEALYTGIMTDTGSFSFNCNSPKTYEVTGKLIHNGVVPDRVHKLVYDNNTEGRIRLLGYALHKMQVLHDFRTAFIALDKDELEKNRSQVGDTEGIVNFALSIKGIILAAFFSIRDGEVKISFRSKGTFSVNEFARRHFNGGGHRNAAGGSFNGSLKQAVELFESLLPEYKTELERDEIYR